MISPLHPDVHDEFVASLTDIAYRALLRQGLNRSFVEVELELWREIGSEYRSRNVAHDAANRIAPLALVS